jgi:DNA polymerase V
MNQDKIFALIDCNNFFVSCERVFRPDLEGQPVVVLSSNDGCAVARSNEAKDLGIPMAAPIFKFKEIFQANNVKTFSANFELYGDISDRITSLLTTITPRIEVYSVDESFLDLSELHIEDYVEWGKTVRTMIQKYIGVPVSIGIAPSKTLAKLAAERAKRADELEGVLNFIGLEQSAIDTYLARTPVKDIWGVGRKLAPKLKAEAVHTALDLRHFPSKRASKLMGVHGRQLVAELNGICCKPLERIHKLQQSIMRGRQFGEDTGEFYVLESAVASLTAKAAAALRRDGQLARSAGVLIRTNRHKPGYNQTMKGVRFTTPTADTGIISSSLIQALQDAHNPRELYHKADVFLYDFVPADSLQTDLLGEVDPVLDGRSKTRMEVVDAVNARYGKGQLRYAAENLSQSWRPRYRMGSPRYTSDWAELPELIS